MDGGSGIATSSSSSHHPHNQNHTSSSSGCPFLRRQSVKRSFADMNGTANNGSHESETTNYLHSEPVHDSLFIPEDDHYHNEHAVHRRHLSPASGNIPPRFPGDGLDFRRPVMSTIIDLTDEDDSQTLSRPLALPAPTYRAQRLPRYHRDIIAITSDDEENPIVNGSTTTQARDTQIVEESSQDRPQYSVLRRPSRGLPQDEGSGGVGRASIRSFADLTSATRPGAAAATLMQAHRSITPHPSNTATPIDLTDDNDDDVILVDTRPRSGANFFPPEHGVRDLTLPEDPPPLFGLLHGSRRLRERLQAYGQGLWSGQRNVERQIHTHDQGPPAAVAQPYGQARHPHLFRTSANEAAEDLPAPGWQTMLGYENLRSLLDFGAPAFDMGMPEANRPPSPRYSPPEPPGSGFTRSPGEDEIVVCPNCGDELAVGTTPVKQELWVIKTCGHAYCGECVQEGLKAKRPTKASAAGAAGKGKARAVDTSLSLGSDTVRPPLRKCVVRDCLAEVKKTTAIRIYSS